MINHNDFDKRVEEVKSRLEDKLKNAHEDEKAELQKRIKYLEDMVEKIQCQYRWLVPKVFISYSGDYGFGLMQIAMRNLQKIESYPGGPHFKVEHGMKLKGATDVLGHIRGHMKPCCVFLGILTKEYNLEEADNKGNKGAPGPWVLYEAGMAINLKLPCVLLVQKGIHEKFWLGVLPASIHASFEMDAFEKGLKSAIILIQGHFEELKEKWEKEGIWFQ